MDYEWKVCGDFKIIALLMGMQAGYTQCNCFCVSGGPEIQINTEILAGLNGTNINLAIKIFYMLLKLQKLIYFYPSSREIGPVQKLH